MNALLNESESASARPALGLVQGNPGNAGGCPGLSLSWGEKYWITPSDGETIIGRWNCLALSCGVAVDSDGHPAQLSTSSNFAVVEAFRGAGLVVLSSERIVGLVLTGATMLGPVDATRGTVLAFSLAHRDLAEITVMLRRGAFGFKETGVSLSSKDEGLLVADLDRSITDGRRAVKASKRDAAMMIAHAAAGIQRPLATLPDQTAMLDTALAGDWETRGEELVAILPAP